MSRALTPAQALERALLTDYRETLWRPFMQAVHRYALIAPGDRIAVCVSGGKDSALMALMLDVLRRRGRVRFETINLAMDPGYAPDVRAQIDANFEALGLTYARFESDVFEAAPAQGARPCFMCARMRRGCLYDRAEALGCNKLALGHHFDDVIETTLMAMLYGGQLQGMAPARRSASHPALTLIRPLYRVHEADIIAWRDAFGLTFPGCSCAFAQAAQAGEATSRRMSVRRLIAALAEDDPKVPVNLFNSIHRVDLDGMAGWKLRGEAHTFLENLNPQDEG